MYSSAQFPFVSSNASARPPQPTYCAKTTCSSGVAARSSPSIFCSVLIAAIFLRNFSFALPAPSLSSVMRKFLASYPAASPPCIIPSGSGSSKGVSMSSADSHTSYSAASISLSPASGIRPSRSSSLSAAAHSAKAGISSTAFVDSPFSSLSRIASGSMSERLSSCSHSTSGCASSSFCACSILYCA